jgi:hypothetical protein
MVGEGIESHGTEGNRKRGALSLGSSKCRGGVDRSEEEVKCAGLYVRSRGRVRFDLGFKVARVAQECYAANKRASESLSLRLALRIDQDRDAVTLSPWFTIVRKNRDQMTCREIRTEKVTW